MGSRPNLKNLNAHNIRIGAALFTAKMPNGTEIHPGSNLRLQVSLITQIKVQGPFRTCIVRKEEEEEGRVLQVLSLDGEWSQSPSLRDYVQSQSLWDYRGTSLIRKRPPP